VETDYTEAFFVVLTKITVASYIALNLSRLISVASFPAGDNVSFGSVYLMELTLYCMERAVEQGEGGIVTDYPD
jgi:hypothetical protein